MTTMHNDKKLQTVHDNLAFEYLEPVDLVSVLSVCLAWW